MTEFDFASFPRVNQQATQCAATIRQQAEHFQVEEVLPFEPSGDGGHVCLQIQKTAENTDWLAKQLARFAGVAPVAVGYAGLKDRHAVTTQWFSINLEGHDEPDWAAFETETIKIIRQTRHNKKLKKGVLAGNHFKLCLTSLSGDKAVFERSLQLIQQQGVPNYFAEQRFGHHYSNLDSALQWFEQNKKPKKRQQKSMILSAARSWLFNTVLAERIKQQNWNTLLNGDVALLSGTKSGSFVVDEINDEVNQRCFNMDLHPTAVMWGTGDSRNTTDSLLLEQNELEAWTSWKQGLEAAKVEKSYRALRVHPENMQWHFEQDHLVLSFYLPSGCYATAVLRELAVIKDASHRNYSESD